MFATRSAAFISWLGRRLALMPCCLSRFPNSLESSVQLSHISRNVFCTSGSPLLCGLCDCTCNILYWWQGHSWWEVWHQCRVSTQMQPHPGFGPQLLSAVLHLLIDPPWSELRYSVPMERYQGTLWRRLVWWVFPSWLPRTQPIQSTAWSCLWRRPCICQPTWPWSVFCMLWTCHWWRPLSAGLWSVQHLPD